ncbi:hypothetical protein M5048_11335, partial [Neisseria meningitidis]|nr:hypothetical protein [Neisseria meningitidis]
QRQSQTIKQRKRQPYKLDSQLIQHIDPLIRRKLSPEQVCAYLCKHHQITLHHSTRQPSLLDAQLDSQL